MATPSPIPQPPTVPFLGNVLLLDKDVPVKSFILLAQQYGEIYQFALPSGSTTVHITTQALVSQVSDDKRFKKLIGSALREVRNLAGDGLFTSHQDEPNWGKAHRILMPAFGTGNVIHMFDDMKDICDQLVKKWERFGSDNIFDPSEDYTRLTFDTIALCSMSYRFNSFYEKEMPKFTQEMVEVLVESGNRAFRSPLSRAVPLLTKYANDKYFAAIKDMSDLAREIVAKRRAHPTEKKDLLTLMLQGKDPKTGQGLSDENIMYNLLTFLIAGHETTSGMLTFATYYLLKYPETLRKLREELDRVVGDNEVTLEHLPKLEYLLAVMRETLRLSPTAPSRAVGPTEDVELIGGDGDPNNPANKKYLIKKDQVIQVQSIPAMRDPRVWGEDAEAFRPERMMGGKFEQLPYQAWQPFGYGLRACIGRPFAWQEAQLVLASVFSKFDVFLADPGYTLQLKQALTIKPKGLCIRVAPRSRPTSLSIPKTIITSSTASTSDTAPGSSSSSTGPLYVYYGSNTGTSEGFAGRIASDAAARGFKAQLAVLDTATGRLPTDGPVVIVTASFEGEPADNAAQFVGWLQNLSEKDNSLNGIKFTVFGCGNREWVRTYQRIPKLIDEALERNGASRLLERGESDAASATFFQSFEEYEVKLWDALSKAYGSKAAPELIAGVDSLNVEFVDSGMTRAKLLRQPDAAMGKVVENRLLTKPGAPEKRHIQITLPQGMTYRSGDYLAILPTNPIETVKRALVHFELAGEQEIVIKSDGPTTLPVNQPISVQQILSGYVELGQPATTRDLQIISNHVKDEHVLSTLAKLRDNYQEEVHAKHLSVLELLEQYKGIALPFGTFLQLLPPMRVRQYSISSSPLADALHVSLTVSVVNAPALSGSNYDYLGVASNYLAGLKAGDLLPVAVRQSNAAFHLPIDPTVPVVMFCAGSGLAPFRGFIQERATQKESGREIGKMLLFFGCRSPDEDYLYSESELKTWIAEGVVDVRPAFSRKNEHSNGCRYVQDRVWNDRASVRELYDAGAKFYTCGSRKASNGVKKTCVDIMKSARPDLSEDAVLTGWEKVQKERFASDIFD